VHPPRRPSCPPLAPSLIALPRPLEAGQTMYRARRKHVVVRTLPRANPIPNRSLAHFDARALSQLRLHKPFRAAEELSNHDVGQVFDEHLAAGDFPHFRCA
jgi:hypothetical protein